MAKQIFWSALITLALTLSPNLAHSVPAKNIKKKATKARIAKRHKSHRRARVHHSRHYRRRSRRVVESSMVPRYSRHYIGETAPLMKVIPQRDGCFLLEPLTPKKNSPPVYSHPARKESDYDHVSSLPRYNTFAPWDFSDLILSRAKAYYHAPYCLGASLETSSATDCSGFVQFIFHGFKIDLPRSSAQQAQVGKTVTRRMDFSKLLPGDILFFRRGHHIGHVGIYLGNGKMIHASNPRTGVTITNLRESYYERTFVVAKRVFVVKYKE
jgi:cell wall-associated NlpC family hydrolase